MITIDEAIAQEKELFEHCKRLYEPLNDEDRSINPLLKNEMEYHKQRAEWLEELKVYQQHEIICNKGYNAGYNKAIDDFVAFTKEHEYKYGNADITSIVIGFNEFIAEQLKGGVSNENCV